MKFLLIGLLAFLSWSVFSTYFYVCKIKGLCNETITNQINKEDYLKRIPPENSQKSPEVKEQLLPDDLIICFAFDKSEFVSDPDADIYFEKSNEYLSKNPLAGLHITGYADETGTEEYNQALGYRRAQRMKLYFENKGLPENKITIVSMGEKEPAGDNNTASGRAQNRRTKIGITK